MRNNLVPTVIVDKNNKITTVYKKDDLETAAATIPAPDGVPTTEVVHKENSDGSLLHAFFPFLKKKAEAKQIEAEAEAIDDALESQRQSIMKNMGATSDFFEEDLKEVNPERLQMISEVLDSLPSYLEGEVEATANTIRSMRDYIHDFVTGLGSRELEIAHSNRDYLKAGVPSNFMMMMVGVLGSENGTRVNNLPTHWNVSRELSKVKSNILLPYTLMGSMQKAVSSSPEQQEALIRLGSAAIRTGVYDDKSFTDEDIPQTFLTLLDEFPDKEDRILAHFEQHGPSSFTHDIVAEALGTHNAVSEGWL